MNNKKRIWIRFYAMMTCICIFFLSLLLFTYAVVSERNFTLTSVSLGLLLVTAGGMMIIPMIDTMYTETKNIINQLSQINKK